MLLGIGAVLLVRAAGVGLHTQQPIVPPTRHTPVSAAMMIAAHPPNRSTWLNSAEPCIYPLNQSTIEDLFYYSNATLEGAGFARSQHTVWGGSVILGPDGKHHMFASSWSSSLGRPGGLYPL